MVVDDLSKEEDIVIRYLPLVRVVAGQVKAQLSSYWQQDDLEQYGVLGLLDAIHRFDSSKGTSFGVYARRRIYGEIIDNVRKTQWAPRRLLQKIKQLEKTKQSLAARLGRESTISELSEALEIDISELHHLESQRITTRVYSLDENSSEFDGLATLLDCIPADDNVEKTAEDRDTYCRLRNGLQQLPERERIIVTLYYYEELTLREIGCVINVSESRVSQLLKRALNNLRNLML